ncbi:hypothetical protein [Kribbella soli]|uniref:DUF998 domain-containing protein n=1 Tax=Kribbella soli TaxID=1124743 RepID=A0A4R0H3T7_9ACTN|nr:hypothetical protein [Kribbella soli]TCC04328.1 hypothetical protein E0H45_35245 [Kribbella soli]
MASQSDFEKRTYNYLRLAMIGVLIMLAVAVLREHWKTASDCWQGSISAYYYTPVHAVFIGSLVTIGICMIVLKGTTSLKDVLLNLGGLLAPVVAFVPTPNAGRCWSEDVISRQADADIANNMVAYFAVGGVALLASMFIGLTSKGSAKWDWKQVAGLVTSVLLWLAGIIWFATSRPSFVGNAHYTAAVLLFAVFIVIVVLSARGQRHEPASRAPERRAFTGAYGLIAVGMCACLAIGLIWRSSAILVVETVLLVLFLLYWVLRTAEQWRAGEPAATENLAESTTP